MALVQHHTDRSMKWLKIMEFLPTVIFFSLLKKKKASSALSFFFQAELFFFYYLFVYSTAVVFLIRQVLCFCLTLVLAISVLTQEICRWTC